MKQYMPLGNFISKASVKRCGEQQLPILSITMKDGLVLQDEKFKKRIASVDTADYKVIPRGKLVQGIHIDEANFGIQDIVDEGIVSPAYKVWEIDSTIVFPKYLEMIMRSPRSLSFYRSKLNGSVNRRGRMTDNDFLAMPVPYVDYERQKKVVSTINRVSSIIALYNHQLQDLNNLIKARFVEMFGDPVSNPKDWPVKPLLDMGDCKNGMNFHYDDSGVELHCLGVGDFQDHSIIDDTTVLSMVSLNEFPSAEYMLQDDDIVFVRSNGNKALVGRCVAVYPGDVPTTFSGFCIRYRKKDAEITIPYLLRVLKTDSIRAKMAGRGANIQNLNQQILGTLVIPVPPMELQKRFAFFVSQIDKSKVVVQKALKETQILFDSLMQKYFG